MVKLAILICNVFFVLAAEFVKLAELPCLEDLVFVGNPLEEKHSAEGNWIEEATKRVPKLKKLDGEWLWASLEIFSGYKNWICSTESWKAAKLKKMIGYLSSPRLFLSIGNFMIPVWARMRWKTSRIIP